MKVDEVKQAIAFQCRNCGACCGPVPFAEEDKKLIERFLYGMGDEEYRRMRRQERPALTCQFRDIENRKCFIHPVRPEICRMQGFYIGLECPHQPQFATRSKDEGHKRLTEKGVI